MKKLILLITVLAFWGCDNSTGSGNITELEGIWNGTDNYSDSIMRIYNFSGSDFNYTEDGHTNDEDGEWYVGTFSINTQTNPKQIDAVIIDCFPNGSEYLGETALGIYKIEGNTLTLASHEPGVPTRPSSFSGGGTRVWVLIKQ